MKILYYSWDIKKDYDYPDKLRKDHLNIEVTSDESVVLDKIENNLVDILIFDTTNIMNYKKLFQYFNEPNSKLLTIAITRPENTFIIEEALEIGLNDYIYCTLTPKQFSAKLRAFLFLVTKEKKVDENGILTVKDLELNPLTREAKRDGKEVSLTNKEYKLLELLLLNKNKIVTRETILETVWGKDYSSNKNIGDVYVTFLRRKIEYGFPTKIIKTIRNGGYIVKD